MYPEDIVLKHISMKIAQFSTAMLFGPEKCLRAPWIGSAPQQLEHQIRSTVQNCCGAVSPCLIFSSLYMLPAVKKDVLPADQRSMVIYEYVCHSWYVLSNMFQKQYGKKTLLLRSREPTDPNQPELSQIENVKQKVRLNKNQRAIQPLANISWNPFRAHSTILICGLKS